MKEKVGEEKKPDSKKPITICRHIEKIPHKIDSKSFRRCVKKHQLNDRYL